MLSKFASSPAPNKQYNSIYACHKQCYLIETIKYKEKKVTKLSKLLVFTFVTIDSNETIKYKEQKFIYINNI